MPAHAGVVAEPGIEPPQTSLLDQRGISPPSDEQPDASVLSVAAISWCLKQDKECLVEGEVWGRTAGERRITSTLQGQHAGT